MSDITLPPTSAKAATSFVGRFKLPLIAFLLSRMWVALFVYLGHLQHPYLSPVPGGWEGVENWWLNPWTTFDSQHFLDIALHGYNAKNAVFFPLYPFLLKLAGDNVVLMAAWGILISNLAFLGALVMFHRLTEQEYSQKVATWGVWLLAFFPTAPYFSAVYTDALFLLFFVSCFWCVKNKQWGWVAVWAVLASLTRNLGPLIFLALAYEWWQARKAEEHNDKAPAWALLAVFAPLVALIFAQGYASWQAGKLFSGVVSQTEYYRALMWPWMPIWLDIKALFNGFNVVLSLHLFATLSVFVFVYRHRIRFSYLIMMVGLMLMHLTLGHSIVPHTLPSARYLSTMFPFIQLLAVETSLLASPRIRIMFMICWLLVTAIISFSFGQKGFVG